VNTFISNRNNSFGRIFNSILGDQPFFSASLLHELSALGGVAFRDIHIGLPSSTSFYYTGYRHHPCIMSMHPVISNFVLLY